MPLLEFVTARLMDKRMEKFGKGCARAMLLATLLR